jgi:hypothetical protein
MSLVPHALLCSVYSIVIVPISSAIMLPSVSRDRPRRKSPTRAREQHLAYRIPIPRGRFCNEDGVRGVAVGHGSLLFCQFFGRAELVISLEGICARSWSVSSVLIDEFVFACCSLPL